MLKKIILFLFFTLLSVALLFAIWYLTKTNGWPLWVGGSILIGVIGLVFGLVFLRRYLLRSNEKKFVKRVIAQEGDSVFISSNDSSLLISDLESQWEKAIQTLYSSKLSKGQNPIYALPWILVIGESGAGKTSLIKNSRLSSAVTDVEVSAQYSGTKNCDWWFFEDAVILDTAGRYSIPVEEKRDNAEWERFLSLLSKYRKEEPLNGLVITISAQRLLEDDKDLIQADALSIRKKIDQLMVSIGAKFPVYLMVTQMDHVYGFVDFCEALPEELQTQAMGYLNDSLTQDWQEVITNGLDTLKQKVTALQLLSIEHGSKYSKEILLFSKEFDRLVSPLKDFSSVVFGDNPYQKIPMLRGIYFSSALSDGDANSKFLSDFDLSQNTPEPKNKSYFIADFFKVILPNDRNIFVPIKEYLSWQRKNYKIAMATWLFVFTSFAGIYTYSYMQNIEVIDDVKYMKQYNKNFKDMDLTSRVIALDKLRLDIIKISKLNQNAIFPFLKLNQSYKAEISLKNLFHEKFNYFLYGDFFLKMNNSINKITNDTPSNEVISYIGFLIDSIDILKQVESNQKDIEVSERFPTWIKNVLFEDESRIDPSVAFLFVKSYIAFQKYNTDKAVVREQIKIFQNLISLIVDKKGYNLHWLMDEKVSQTPSIKITTFFRDMDRKILDDFPIISGSLTLKGRENLLNNINLLMKEIDNVSKIKSNLLSFLQWYDGQFYYRWKNFAMGFNNIDRFLKLKNKEQLLYAMASDQSPYFDFIHTMAKEFKAYKSLQKPPAWSKLVIELDEVMSIARDIRDSKNSFLSKIGDEKNKFIAKAQADVDRDGYIKRIKSAGILNKYIDDLTKLSTVVDRKQSKILINDFFAQDASKQTPLPSFSQCHNHYKQFIHSLPYYANSGFIYNLIAGPKNYIIDYSINQMDTVLNDIWQNDVLGSIPLSTDHNLLMSLFNEQKGLVWKYVNGVLKPFVKLDQYGYSAKKVSGYKFDINPSFLRYINSGINLLSVYKPSYDISITTFPFDINRDAKVAPNYVDLHLRCAKADYILRNENYSLTKSFNWVPSKCGETIITFGFDNFKVRKTYEGENGFLYFLKDFRDGTKIFRLKDFDKVVPELKQNNISFIKVTYDISNEGNILKLLDKTPYEIPKKVIGSEW